MSLLASWISSFAKHLFNIFFATFIDFNDIFYLLYLNKHFCHSPLRYVYQKFYLSLCFNFHSLKVILE